jgi:hypothetical protein
MSQNEKREKGFDLHNGENSIDLERLYSIVNEWSEKNLGYAIFRVKETKTDFKFRGVVRIPRAWWANFVMVVGAELEYQFGGISEREVVSLQIDTDGRVVGFNLLK